MNQLLIPELITEVITPTIIPVQEQALRQSEAEEVPVEVLAHLVQEDQEVVVEDKLNK